MYKRKSRWYALILVGILLLTNSRCQNGNTSNAVMTSPIVITLDKDAASMVEYTGTTSVETLPTQPEDLKFGFTPEAEMTKNTPHVSPYIKVMVVDVAIRYLETDPVQVEIVIWGTLPDQCGYGFYSVENRNGQNVKVGLDGMHPADNSCLQTAQTIEYVLRLGRDLPEAERGFSPGDYELMVNNYQTSFSIK